MEIRIPNGSSSEQVFKADDADGMVNVLSKGQLHATKKIRAQQKQIEQQSKQIEKLQGMVTKLLADTVTATVLEKLQQA